MTRATCCHVCYKPPCLHVDPMPFSKYTEQTYTNPSSHTSFLCLCLSRDNARQRAHFILFPPFSQGCSSQHWNDPRAFDPTRPPRTQPCPFCLPALRRPAHAPCLPFWSCPNPASQPCAQTALSSGPRGAAAGHMYPLYTCSCRPGCPFTSPARPCPICLTSRPPSLGPAVICILYAAP